LNLQWLTFAYICLHLLAFALLLQLINFVYICLHLHCKMNEKQRIVSESIVKQMKAHIWITSQARPALINPPPLIAFIPINPGGLLTPGGG
jgi:hypothetical protein